MGMTGRLLFALGLLLAGLLVALVVVAPLIDTGEATNGWRKVVALFGNDAGLRRTSLASAAGLVVTACVFFRRGSLVTPARRATVTRPRTPGAAGA
jgi:hypothetical protein